VGFKPFFHFLARLETQNVPFRQEKSQVRLVGLQAADAQSLESWLAALLSRMGTALSRAPQGVAWRRGEVGGRWELSDLSCDFQRQDVPQGTRNPMRFCKVIWDWYQFTGQFQVDIGVRSKPYMNRLEYTEYIKVH
jgi:hypothetical protein